MSLNLGIIASSKAASGGGGGTDADAQAFFNRVTAAGGTLSATEQSAVNTFVVSMKANSLWSLMKVIYPFVGSSAASCAQNLKSSSFTGAFTNAFTFIGGIKGAGTSFFNTNFRTQADWTSTSNAAMGFVSATNEPGGFIIDMGAAANPFNIDNSSAICSSYSGTFFAGVNCTSVAPGVTNPNTIGFFVTSRISTTSYSKYKRGSSTINSTNTDAIGANINAFIYLSANNAPPNATLFSTKLYNFCFLGDGLTQAQVDTFWSIIQTLNTTLGR